MLSKWVTPLLDSKCVVSEGLVILELHAFKGGYKSVLNS